MRLRRPMSGEPVAHRRTHKFSEATPRQGGGASDSFSGFVGKAQPFRSSGGTAAKTMNHINHTKRSQLTWLLPFILSLFTRSRATASQRSSVSSVA